MHNEPFTNRILMSDWAANVEYITPSLEFEDFISELILHSLVRDEILVQDEALAQSNKLADWFAVCENARILDELFDIGTVVVLKQRPSEFPTHSYKTWRITLH